MPEHYRIHIASEVFAELGEICTYIERDSPQNASSVAQRLVGAIDSLQVFPKRYRVHEHRSDPALSVRSMSVRPFVVYYRLDETRRIVRVLSVRHGARRPKRRFS